MEQSRSEISDLNLEEKWDKGRSVLLHAAEKVLGYRQIPQRNDWFDKEYRLALENGNKARIETLQRWTRASAKDYSEKGRQ